MTQQKIDGPVGKMIAAGLLCVCAGALAYIHREDLFPPEATAPAGDDPVAQCIAQRAADIDGMVADGVIDPGRADLFKTRAASVCEAQAG